MSTRHPIGSRVYVRTLHAAMVGTYLGHHDPEPDAFDVVQLDGEDEPVFVHTSQVQATPLAHVTPDADLTALSHRDLWVALLHADYGTHFPEDGATEEDVRLAPLYDALTAETERRETVDGPERLSLWLSQGGNPTMEEIIDWMERTPFAAVLAIIRGKVVR